MNKATKSIIQSANKEPVLLVDDTADLVCPLQLFLNETGYQTDVALGAEAALKKIADKLYKIISIFSYVRHGRYYVPTKNQRKLKFLV